MGYDTAVQTPNAKDFNEDLTNIKGAKVAEQAVDLDTEQKNDGELEP